MAGGSTTHRPLGAPHKGSAPESLESLESLESFESLESPETSTKSSEQSGHSGSSVIARRECLFAAIRLSRALAPIETSERGAVIDFPTTLVIDGSVHDLDATATPGFFADGHHMVLVKTRIGTLDVTGRFELSIGESFGVAPSQ